VVELKPTEMFALSQILICGKITHDEFKRMNNFLSAVQDDALETLEQEGFLEHTLYETR